MISPHTEVLIAYSGLFSSSAPQPYGDRQRGDMKREQGEER